MDGGFLSRSITSRRARDDTNIKGQSGAVSVVQRGWSDLRLNPHLHAIVMGGVFVAYSDSVVFHPLTRFVDSDVADLLQVIRVPVVNFLVRRGVVESSDELTLLDVSADDADSSLTQLAREAVCGSIPAEGVAAKVLGIELTDNSRAAWAHAR